MSQLLQNAVYGGIMILAAAALRRGLKDRFIPKARLALWAVCLFRLLTPAAPESVLSLWRLGRFLAPEERPVPAPVAGVPVTDPALAMGNVSAPVAAPAEAAEAGVPWGAILAAIWVIVGAALAVRFVLSYARTRRAVGHAILLERDDPQYAVLPKCARLREGVMEGAPLTFGVVRPTVVLSPGLDGAELECVLAHEGVHASRRDNLWHYVTALALVVHWWNPAVWLMARLLRRDVELSCDRAAVKKLGADKRAEYANALISMATQGKDPAFCQTFGRKAAEERVISIMKYKKTTIAGAALTLALVLAVSVGFASNPAADVPEEDGDLVPVDSMDETVEYYGKTYARKDLSQETLDWLDWYLSLSEEGQLSVSFVPPELIAGLDVSADDANAGSMGEAAQYICTRQDCGNTGVHTHDGVTYKGWTNKYAIPPACTAEDCTVSGPHWHENGEVIHFYYTCGEGDEPIGEPELNYDPKVADSAGKSGEICGLPLAPENYTGDDEPVVCPPEAIDQDFPVCGYPTADYFTKTSCPFGPHTCADCGVEGCTVDYLHMHSGIFTFTMGPVCPREDCDLWGCHEHDGVMYSCNGNHHAGGVCDGSCYVHSTPIYYELNGIDTTQSTGVSSGQGQGNGYGNGHHSDSHHGNGHH